MQQTRVKVMLLLLPWFVAGMSAEANGDGKAPGVDLRGDLLPAGAIARMGTVRLRLTFNGKLAFSPDGKTLAIPGADGTVRMVDSFTGKVVRACKGHVGPVHTVSWSPDGGKLATAGHDKTVRVWDAAACKELYVCKGHRGAIHSVSWSPDGGKLATAGRDRTVRIWESATGKELHVCKGHVRRAKVRGSSRCESCPGKGRPGRVAISAVAEVTKRLKPGRQKAASGRLRVDRP